MKDSTTGCVGVWWGKGGESWFLSKPSKFAALLLLYLFGKWVTQGILSDASHQVTWINIIWESGDIYRWFLIRSCTRDNLSLVIPNNKTIEHWRLKVLFIRKVWLQNQPSVLYFNHMGTFSEYNRLTSSYVSGTPLHKPRSLNPLVVLHLHNRLFMQSTWIWSHISNLSSIPIFEYSNGTIRL